MKKERINVDEWLAALVDSEVSWVIDTCRCDVMKTKWVIPEKEMDEHLVFLVESGQLSAKLNGVDYMVEPGTAVWITPGDARELSGDNRRHPLRYYKMRFNFRRNDVDLSPSDLTMKNQAWDLLPIFQMLVSEYSGEGEWRSAQLRQLLSVFSTMFFRMEASPVGGQVLSRQQRLTIDEFIASNMDHHVSSADLANELRLSQDYFSRLFVKEFGETPRNYIKRYRVNYAANRLVESMLTVKELAGEMGYNNVNLFCRQFKEIYGMTPTQYRDRLG